MIAIGREGFPESLPALRDGAPVAEAPAHWGSFMFVSRDPRILVGLGGLYGPPDEGSVETGHAIAPEFQGRGLFGRAELSSAPYAVGHVHCAIAEAALVDELEVQAQIGGEGRLAGAERHGRERQQDLVDDTGA